MGGQFLVEWESEEGKCGRVWASEGECLLDVFRRNRIFMESVCNGNGTCGKCRIQVVQGLKEVSALEQRFFSKEEITAGYRLACLVKAEPGLKVQLVQTFQIRQNGIQEKEINCQGIQKRKISREGKQENGPGSINTQNELGIAVDLGSTMLAAVLIDAQGNVLAQASAVNSQRLYGADVVSRIQAANQGYGKRLQECICLDLEQIFRTLCARIQYSDYVSCAHITRIVIAGNTTMLHLLRGYSCRMLGQAPFEPVCLKQECFLYKELFADIPECNESQVYLLPGLSAFVGADITAGLYSSGFLNTLKTEVACFVDLGTNGEMAVGNQTGFVTASAPAGPAFEGGNLSSGMPAVSGAISNVSFLYHKVRIQTVGQKKPCGICGTGALEAVAALKKEGLLDRNGLLAPGLFEKGFLLAKRVDGSHICLSQADIREIQMAKAAICAGVETLFAHYCKDYIGKEMDFEIISHVYLAGGFGYYLSADTAAEIGLFPVQWKEKIAPCGNTSLKGAAAFLVDLAGSACAEGLKEIPKKNRTIQLAEDEMFQNLFIERMGF